MPAIDKIELIDIYNAAYIGKPSAMDFLRLSGFYTVECFDKNGNFKWKDTAPNVVCTPGKNDLLDKYFTASGYTAAFFMGLISGVSFSAVAATDTAAQINGTNGWKEAGPSNAPNYTSGTRPAITWNAASGGSKTTSIVVFTATGSPGIAKGCFIVTTSTKEGTTGVLYSAGLFAEGDKNLSSGDILNVTYTAQAA